MPCKFFDSHIHLNSGRVNDWENKNDWVFNNVSTNLDDLVIALDQAKKYSNVFVTVGIHPLEINGLYLDEVMDKLNRFIANNPKVIAIGEIGLDFYRGDKVLEKDKQERWFYSQFELARRHNLPLMLHIRNAHEEALYLLENIIDWRGVIHCFEGKEEILNRYLNLRGVWMISVSPLIFRPTSFFRNLIHKVNIERLLVETDAPYLATNCEKILDIIEFIAKEKRINFEDCKKILWNNFKNFFNLNI